MKLNQKGFTLAEKFVGVSLLAIVGMVAASFFTFSAKTQKEIVNDLEDSTDNVIAERMLLRDLKMSEPSFNNILVTDDNGLGFFDFDAAIRVFLIFSCMVCMAFCFLNVIIN